MMNFNWKQNMSEVSIYHNNLLISTIPDIFTEEQAHLIAEEVYWQWVQENELGK